MKRVLMTEDELLARINRELHAGGEVPKEVYFSGPVRRYRQPDANGLNWSPDLVLRGSGISPSIFGAQAGIVLRSAIERFNLAPK